jgi:hypothetical protein
VQVIIWDWHDLSYNRKCHIDATTFVDGRVVRFEIDGERHIVGINGGRRREDVVKDAFMTANNHGLLR